MVDQNFKKKIWWYIFQNFILISSYKPIEFKILIWLVKADISLGIKKTRPNNGRTNIIMVPHIVQRKYFLVFSTDW
jgi:hypothetical protein